MSTLVLYYQVPGDRYVFVVYEGKYGRFSWTCTWP